jgi:hypothetical protein
MSRKCRCGNDLKPLFVGDALADWYCNTCKLKIVFYL